MVDAQSEDKTTIKLVVVGDGSVGKTCILLSYTKNEFPEDYVPTVFENYVARLQVDSKMINLSLWDTAGQEEYSNLRSLAYPGADIFLITFSVVEPASFDNAINVWYKELSTKNVPVLFVGNKIDLREEKLNDPKIKGNPKLAPIESHIAHKKISELKPQAKYMETSALTQQGLKQVFDEAIRIVLKKRQKPTGASGKNTTEKKKNKICTVF